MSDVVYSIQLSFNLEIGVEGEKIQWFHVYVLSRFYWGDFYV